MGPVCTIMVGRLDDWLKVLAEKNNVAIDPGYLEWAGVAVFKKTYQIFRERGYRLRLLVGRVSQPHALERIHRRRRGDFAALLVAGSLQCQRHRSASAHRRTSSSESGRELIRKFPDFRRAYTENGLSRRGV